MARPVSDTEERFVHLWTPPSRMRIRATLGIGILAEVEKVIILIILDALTPPSPSTFSLCHLLHDVTTSMLDKTGYNIMYLSVPPDPRVQT